MSQDEAFDYDELQAEELLRLAHEGYVDVEPPQESNTLFEDQFDRRAAEITRKPFAGTQPVSIVRQKTGPWTGSNQLGFEASFAPDANNKQTVFKMDENGDPEVWSIILGCNYLDDTADAFIFAVTAELNIGCGGVTQQVSVDWIEGTVIRASLNALNVIATYDTGGLGVNLIPTDLKLRTNLARGNIGGRNPTRTIRSSVGNAIPSVTGAIKIPKFAKRLFVVSGADPAVLYNAANELHFDVNTAATVTLARIDGDQLLNFSDGIPIPNGARFVEFVNRSGTVIDFLCFIFELSL